MCVPNIFLLSNLAYNSHWNYEISRAISFLIRVYIIACIIALIMHVLIKNSLDQAPFFEA